ncbi:MAG: undecaprenyldiphospho-muramoylpentapeptide beta-N-acetylglucosaminyltransferase [Candidatus Melainabacteria bacterium]|nr:undecaprenyldiphospho-muramoylpentapeptide beta-N-acetylglucosaminyltransferase [Candidatus Melainabacteria bacterium]
MNHRIVLTGGGTGGHIYPALSVHDELLRQNPDVDMLYIGAKDHMEEKLCNERGIKFYGLDVSGLPRKASLSLIVWVAQMSRSMYECRNIFKDFAPTAVLGTGGYASAPALFAAKQLNIPFAVHEPDAYPGLVNKLFSRWAEIISLGMEGARDRLPAVQGQVIINGNPVGANFVNPKSRADACLKLNVRADLKTIVVTGGSQGARALNETLIQALPQLLERGNLQIIHQCGEKNLEEVKSRVNPTYLSSGLYIPKAYFEDLALAYVASDLAVCRAGAMTLAELSALGKPAVFIPYPHAAQNHQFHNAKYFESKNAARVIRQDELSVERFVETIKELVLDGNEKLQEMQSAMAKMGKPEAAKSLALQLLNLSAAKS